MDARLTVLALAALAAACGDDVPASRRPRGRAPTKRAAAAPRCGAPGAAGARVMLDVSQSMRGFSIRGSALFEGVHRALDEAVGRAGAAQPLVRCEVGTSVSCNARRTYAALGDGATYSADHARLDLALRRPPPGDDAASRDPLDHARLAVLVTDGMQSSAAGSAGGSDPEQACLAGADPRCLRALLQRRVAEGYGVWLGVLLLPFRGEHFAERGIDASLVARVSEHLAEAQRHRPYHETPLRVLPRSTRTTSYGYEGLRPLVVLAFSCDPAVGQGFVDALGHGLAAARIVGDGDGRWSATQLAPLDPPVRALTTVRRDGPQGGLELGRPRHTGGRLLADVACEESGRGRLRVVTSRRGGALPPFVSEQVTLAATGRALSRAALGAPLRAGEDWTMELRCLRLAARTHRAELELASHYTFDPARVDPELFWRKLSAPNTFEMPERVYALDDLATGVLEAAVRRRRPWGRVELRIERR